MHLAFVVADNVESGHQAILVTDAKGHGLVRIPIDPAAEVRKVFLLPRATGKELWVLAHNQITRLG